MGAEVSTHLAQLKVDGRRAFFTSDTHYAHANICRATSKWPANETRGFDSLGAMNQALVEGINHVVPADAVLFHLGDWSFAGQANVGEFRRRLNVREVHLILGNHDHHMAKGRELHHFASVSPYMEISVDGQEIVLFHYGCRVWNASHKGSWLLYGHSHGSLPPHGRSMDVGVDTNLFRPYSFQDVRLFLGPREMPIVDHHGLRADVTP